MLRHFPTARCCDHGFEEEGKTVGDNVGEGLGSCVRGHWALIERMRKQGEIDNH
jgi:hypothetical protein